MKCDYFIDNEGVKTVPVEPLTIAVFMARFFNYLFRADRIN